MLPGGSPRNSDLRYNSVMSIRDQIQQNMTAALKAQEKRRLDALRYLYAQIKNKEIETKRTLTDDETIKLLGTEAKRRRESIEAYQKGGRQDLIDKETFELSVIEEYLPKQLSDDELRTMIDEVKAKNPGADFGTLMRETMKQVSGRADGGRMAALIKQ